jgi:hypothetical protein
MSDEFTVVIQYEHSGREYSLAELEGLPTLVERQADDLKIENMDAYPPYRYWLSRMTVDDGAPYDNAVDYEVLVGGSWQRVHMYQAQ